MKTTSASYCRRFAPKCIPFLVAAVLVTGCGTQSPKARVNVPAAPQDQFDNIEVATHFPPAGNLSQNTVQVPYSEIKVRSSVVISHGDFNRDKKSQSTGINESEALSSAKEEMHKELIRRGFRVIDQAQVNNRLRELAINQPCPDGQLWWRCTTYLNGEEVARLDNIKAAVDQGEVQSQQFAQELRKYRALWERRATNLKALLNAAQTNQIAVDYVLEIKAFNAEKPVNQILDLYKVTEIRRFIKDYPDLESKLIDKQYLKCAGLGAEMKARLVNTRNSEVVWLGGHVVSELSQPDNEFLIELGVRRYVANRDEVMQFLENNASKIRKKNSTVEIPEWKYSAELIGPKLIQGTCNVNNRQPQILQLTTNDLAGQVARDLMSTIKVAGHIIQTARPPVFSEENAQGGASSKGDFLKDTVGPIRGN